MKYPVFGANIMKVLVVRERGAVVSAEYSYLLAPALPILYPVAQPFVHLLETVFNGLVMFGIPLRMFVNIAVFYSFDNLFAYRDEAVMQIS